MIILSYVRKRKKNRERVENGKTSKMQNYLHNILLFNFHLWCCFGLIIRDGIETSRHDQEKNRMLSVMPGSDTVFHVS